METTAVKEALPTRGSEQLCVPDTELKGQRWHRCLSEERRSAPPRKGSHTGRAPPAVDCCHVTRREKFGFMYASKKRALILLCIVGQSSESAAGERRFGCRVIRKPDVDHPDSDHSHSQIRFLWIQSYML